MLTADALLAGPRGRRVCWELVDRRAVYDAGRPAAWTGIWRAAVAGDLSSQSGPLADLVAWADPVALAADQSAVLAALQMSVDSARYWQPPDAHDRALAAAPVRAALEPVAAALAAATGCAWWTSPLDWERQRYTQFLGNRSFDEPQLSGAARRVAAWRADTAGLEARLRREPPDPLGSWSGSWWSDPARSGLPLTSRPAPGLGALRLALVEDSLGWEQARCWPLRPVGGARVFEVDGPAAWSALVTRYPLDVSQSRRHDWWQATGRDGDWLIPDFQAVARDYDAVHVTVLGYLMTAGVAVPAGLGSGSATLLAGWDPDTAWWLTDMLERDGPPEEWTADEDAASGWRRADGGFHPAR